MTVRADHVAGGAFIALGVFVFLISGDLPFGTLTAPGAGMMPLLMAGLMMLFAAIVMVGGGSSRMRRAQTGFVRSYALSMLGGALLVAIAFLAVRLG